MLKRITQARYSRYLLVAAFAICSSLTTIAQSSDQSYPTPVLTNEVDGVIKARDVGDARLTTYFFTFNGEQGDIFVNVVSKNFNGDIDIFTAEGLKPISKIVVYADTSENETGRVIYLRKPEKLILRVEGRSPNDDPATFKLKFAGSFVAAVDTGEQQPELPEAKVENDTGVVVNSVGTIVAVTPKPKRTPKPVETPVEKPVEKTITEKKADESVAEKSADSNATQAASEPKPEATTERRKPEVIVSENIPPAKNISAPPKKPAVTRTRSGRRVLPKQDDEQKASGAETSSSETKPASPPPASRSRRTPPPVTPKKPDPLEAIHLVIVFKDGRTIERPMSEVLRFTVDNGVLTVISKDGSIGRYPIIDVLKTTIE